MTEIIMPQVGQDIPTAIITEWVKSEGDQVKKGEVIAIVESDKATFEVEAETDGILTKILYKEGEEAEVFKPIAYINGPGEDKDTIETDRSSEDDFEAVEKDERESPAEARVDAGNGMDEAILKRPRSSPAARRLAREKGIDLKSVKGTGHGGRIIFPDVEEAVEDRPDELSTFDKEKQFSRLQEVEIKESDTVIPFTRMRKVIAGRMSLSKQTIPHFYIYLDVDMTAAMNWRSAFNEEQGTQITITDLIIKATAMSLQEKPDLNAWVEEERIILKGEVNIGVATSVKGGLVVPVIHQANHSTLREISTTVKKLTKEARRGTFKPVRSGTFTVTSLGMFGVKGFFPIINPPQCAILAAGAAEKTVKPGGDESDMMRLTLAADHRAVDGTQAADFLTNIKSLLEDIDQLSEH